MRVSVGLLSLALGAPSGFKAPPSTIEKLEGKLFVYVWAC